MCGYHHHQSNTKIVLWRDALNFSVNDSISMEFPNKLKANLSHVRLITYPVKLLNCYSSWRFVAAVKPDLTNIFLFLDHCHNTIKPSCALKKTTEFITLVIFNWWLSIVTSHRLLSYRLTGRRGGSLNYGIVTGHRLLYCCLTGRTGGNDGGPFLNSFLDQNSNSQLIIEISNCLLSVCHGTHLLHDLLNKLRFFLSHILVVQYKRAITDMNVQKRHGILAK